MGEPGTNTIKGLEGRGLGACGDFPAQHSGRGGYLQVRGQEGDAGGGCALPSRFAITSWGCCWDMAG